jgi:hypothetical protein
MPDRFQQISPDSYPRRWTRVREADVSRDAADECGMIKEEGNNMTPAANVKAEIPGTADLLTEGDLVDRLSALTSDQLRALQGRLEDCERIIKAILRERVALGRRDASWRARELISGGSEKTG